MHNPALVITLNSTGFAAVPHTASRCSSVAFISTVPFDGRFAQRISERAARILTATDAGELLPRHTTTPTTWSASSTPDTTSAGARD